MAAKKTARPRKARPDAPRQDRESAGPAPQHTGGGRPRDQWAVEDLTYQCLLGLAQRQSRAALARALGKFAFESGLAATPEPMPKSTLEEYVRRAGELRVEMFAGDRQRLVEDARIRAQRISIAAQADKQYSAAVRAEELVRSLEGTERPRGIEISAPGGGPVAVKTVPEALSALQRMVNEQG